jgi:hypothetical protein
MIALVADRDPARAIEMGESAEPVTTQHRVDGGTGVPEHRTEPVRPHLQLLAGTHDPADVSFG